MLFLLSLLRTIEKTTESNRHGLCSDRYLRLEPLRHSRLQVRARMCAEKVSCQVSTSPFVSLFFECELVNCLCPVDPTVLRDLQAHKSLEGGAA